MTELERALWFSVSKPCVLCTTASQPAYPGLLSLAAQSLCSQHWHSTAPSSSALSILSRMSFPREGGRALQRASPNDLIPFLVLTPGQRRIQTPSGSVLARCASAVAGVNCLPISLPNLAPGQLSTPSALWIPEEGPQLFASCLPSSPGGFSPELEAVPPLLYPVPASPSYLHLSCPLELVKKQ